MDDSWSSSRPTAMAMERLCRGPARIKVVLPNRSGKESAWPGLRRCDGLAHKRCPRTDSENRRYGTCGLESPDRLLWIFLYSGRRRRRTDSLRSDRFEQHVVSVEIEKLLLTACERANIDSPDRIDPHALKRWLMCNRRNNQPPVVFKAYEATIEQVIDARRQQQSVLAVQSFLIRRVAPRLTMARDQMNGIFYT